MVNYLEKNQPDTSVTKNCIDYFTDLQGTYLKMGNTLIPFPELSLFNYKKIDLDELDSFTEPTIDFGDGNGYKISKKGLIRKLDRNLKSIDKE